MSHHSSYYRGLRFGYGGFGGLDFGPGFGGLGFGPGFGGLGFGPGFGCGSFRRLGHGFGFSGYGFGSGSGRFRHGCCHRPSFYGGYRFSSFF